MSHLLAVLGIVPILMVPFLVLGYVRTRRLQADVPDARLRALGWFFLLYGVATVLQFALHVTFTLAGQDQLDVGTLAGQLFLPNNAPPIVWAIFWVRHALVLAALAPVAFEYLRRPKAMQPAAALLPLAFAMVGVQSIEAALALVPAVLTTTNYWGRHTRRSRHVATGFAALAVGHLGLVALLFNPSQSLAAHLVVLSQILALSGAIRLAVAVPRRA